MTSPALSIKLWSIYYSPTLHSKNIYQGTNKKLTRSIRHDALLIIFTRCNPIRPSKRADRGTMRCCAGRGAVRGEALQGGAMPHGSHRQGASQSPACLRSGLIAWNTLIAYIISDSSRYFIVLY